jgi:hypothetical protein
VLNRNNLAFIWLLIAAVAEEFGWEFGEAPAE